MENNLHDASSITFLVANYMAARVLLASIILLYLILPPLPSLFSEFWFRKRIEIMLMMHNRIQISVVYLPQNMKKKLGVISLQMSIYLVVTALVRPFGCQRRFSWLRRSRPAIDSCSSVNIYPSLHDAIIVMSFSKISQLSFR